MVENNAEYRILICREMFIRNKSWHLRLRLPHPSVLLHLWQAACDESAEKSERAFILFILGSTSVGSTKEVLYFVLFAEHSDNA